MCHSEQSLSSCVYSVECRSFVQPLCNEVWEARTGEVTAKWLIPGSDSEEGRDRVWSCAFSPSGEHILTGSSEGAIVVNSCTVGIWCLYNVDY